MDQVEADDQSGGGGSQKGVLTLETKSVQPYATQDEYLYAMKEDLAEWFNTLYGLAIDVDNFFDQLETGVVMCQHANNVTSFIREQIENNPDKHPYSKNGRKKSTVLLHLSEKGVQYRSQVKAGSFQCRDNVSNFIGWCRALGINNVILFETEDLVMRKNEWNVVLCLLEVARRGAEYGMLAPKLVEMEQEIDAEIAGEEPPRPQPQRKTVDLRSLDETVREMVGRCTCATQFPMYKISEGKYKIGDSGSLIFVRILRKHVMVRVGGGWDTLENYLCRHDPCRCPIKAHVQPGKSIFAVTASVVKKPFNIGAPNTLIEVHRRTPTPSMDTPKKNTSNSTMGPPISHSVPRKSQRSHSLTQEDMPSADFTPQRRSSSTINTTPQRGGGSLNKSLDTSAIKSLRSLQPNRKHSTVPISKSTDFSSISTPKSSREVTPTPKGKATAEAKVLKQNQKQSAGSPGLHRRFSSANDLEFPKEMTLASVSDTSLPRQRPVSARARGNTPSGMSAASPAVRGSHADSSSGRHKKKQSTTHVSVGHARSRSVEPCELNVARTPRRVNNNNNNSINRNNTEINRPNSVAGTRQNPIRTNVGFTPGKTQRAWDGETCNDSRSVSSGRNISKGNTTKPEPPQRPRTPKVNISQDRILPDKPKFMSRSRTADLSHVGELLSSPESENGSLTLRTNSSCMSYSSNQSSTLSLASSFDEYPEAPPEDESLNAQMEKMFVEYRKQELTKKGSDPSKGGRHRRSHSADILEMDDDAVRSTPRGRSATRTPSNSSVDMPHYARRSSTASVEDGRSSNGTWCMASARQIITPTPTRTSSLRSATGAAKNPRTRVNERTNDKKDIPSRSTAPQPSDTSHGRSRSQRSSDQTARSQSVTRDPYNDGQRSSSRMGSRTGSRNPSRDNSLSRSRPATAMGQSEYERSRHSAARPQSARTYKSRSREDLLNDTPTPRKALTTTARSNCVYTDSISSPESARLSPAESFCSSEDPMTQLQLSINSLTPHTPKPRKAKQTGHTRIPMPVEMRQWQKYDESDTPLKRYDSGVDINNMSPTESSVHSDDAWQQELLGCSNNVHMNRCVGPVNGYDNYKENFETF